MAATLQITDGTTTINLIGGDGYNLIYKSWSPGITRLRESSMGSPYEDVVETIPIAIIGDSTDQIMERYAALANLLHQSEVWSKNDAGVDAVLVKYQPNGSTLASPLQAVITGASKGQSFLNPPSSYNDASFIGGVLSPIILRFTRSGLWLGATEVKAAAQTTGNPAIQTIADFTATPKIPVPYDMDIEFTGVSGSASGSQNTYVLTANAADKLYTIECEGMTGGTPTVEASASAGNVHRQADSGSASLVDSSFAMNANARLYAFWVVVAASAALTNWTITATLYYSDTYDESAASTRPVVFGGTTQVTALPLGIISTGWQPGRLKLTAVPDKVSSETLDLDYVCGIALDESSNIFRAVPSGPAYGAGDEIIVAQRLLTNKTALVTSLTSAAVTAHLGYEGSAYPYASGNSLSALVFGASPGYRLTDLGTTESDVTFTATRTMGYLTPL